MDESRAGLTKRGFLSKWAFTTAIDPRQTLEHALLLGHRGDPATLFSISRGRRAERKSDSPGRSVFQVRDCCVHCRDWCYFTLAEGAVRCGEVWQASAGSFSLLVCL